MEKIKVAITLPSFALGGAQRMVYELVRSLDKDSFEICVICFEKSVAKHLEEGLRSDGIDIRHIGPFHKIRVEALRQMAAILDDFSPDVVHAHLGGSQAALPWCVIHRVPIVVTLHTTMPKALNPLVEKMARLDSHGKLIKLVAVSEETRYQAIRHFRCNSERILEVDNGIDLDEYFPSNSGGSTVFINVGTQNENKNQAMLLSAFQIVARNHPASRLILVGDGPEHDALLAASKGDSRIVLPGSVTNVAEWLSRANVYVQCSYREAMPMAVIEAMASGLPVITTNVGGVGDVVRDGREGLLIEPGSKGALVGAMERFFDAGFRSRMASSSLLRASCFSSSEMAKGYERIYLKAVRHS